LPRFIPDYSQQVKKGAFPPHHKYLGFHANSMNIGIVYSKSQEIIRRRIDTRIEVRDLGRKHDDGSVWLESVNVPGDDKQLSHHKSLILPGEAWAEIPDHIHDSWGADSYLKAHEYLCLKGNSGVDDHHIVVNRQGDQIGSHLMDPEIDAPEGKFGHQDWHAHYNAKDPEYKIIKSV
jgi:hypothetical protein